MKVKHPHDGGPHRADIRAAVHRKDETLASVARKARIPKSYVYQAMSSRISPYGEIAIAEFIEIDPRKLWPGRWEKPTPAREVWLLKNAEKLEAWRGNRLEDVGR